MPSERHAVECWRRLRLEKCCLGYTAKLYRGFSDASDTLMDQIIGLLLDYTINMIIFLETHNIIDYA